MTRRSAAMVVALVAMLAGTLLVGPPAHAATKHWTGPLCTRANTDMPVRVCSQVQYKKSGAKRKPIRVYTYWSPSYGANQLDGVKIRNAGRWRHVGTDLGNYRMTYVGKRTRWRKDTRCFVKVNRVDGWFVFDDTTVRPMYHRCW